AMRRSSMTLARSPATSGMPGSRSIPPSCGLPMRQTATGSFTDLGMLPGANDTRATAINNAGQVVGYSANVEYDEWSGEFYYNFLQAFFWDATDGMVDLQYQLLPPSDATLQYA